ncbi:MAG: hypothetical protein Q9M22_00880 [Mariprofundaceae bacterium]|nr:hypothetical protein [Mariprofundaceae bacterium]
MKCTHQTIKHCKVILIGLCLWLSPSMGYADETRYVNIAAFQMKDGNSESIFTGRYSELMKMMEDKKAILLFMLRTPSVKGEDIINFQSDVLHLTKKGNLANGGLNCQFSFDNESDEDSQFYSLSGICAVLTPSAKGTDKHRIIMKRVMLADILPTINVWTRLYHDPKTNVVFYVDMD